MRKIFCAVLLVCWCVVGGTSQTRTATESLMAAFEARNSKAALKAIESGANVNARDNDGNTMLMYAVMAFDGEDVKTLVMNLVARGADVNAKNNDGFTALHVAALLEKGQESALVLIAMGAFVNARANDGNTPLHLAAFSNVKTEIATALIVLGADKRAKNENKLEPKDMLMMGNKKISGESRQKMEILLN